MWQFAKSFLCLDGGGETSRVTAEYRTRKGSTMTLHTEELIDNAVSAEKLNGLDPEIVKRIK